LILFEDVFILSNFFHTFFQKIHNLDKKFSYLCFLFHTLKYFFILVLPIYTFEYFFILFGRCFHIEQPFPYLFSQISCLWTNCMYIYLQLKELVIFSDAPYDYITLLSLHSAPRDGCDRHRLHPLARHRTHFYRVVKHDHVEYWCCMLELPVGNTQVLACAPRL
jgi:hypothetical protein